MTDAWERGKKSVTYYNKEEFIPRRDIRNTISETIAEGDKLQKKADVYDSVISFREELANEHPKVTSWRLSYILKRLDKILAGLDIQGEKVK